MKRLVIVLLVMLFVLGMVTQGWAQTTPTPPKTGGELKLDMESTFQMGVTAMSSQGLVKHVTQGIMVNTNGWLRMKTAISFAVPDNSRDAQLWLQSGFGVYTPLPPLKEGGKPSEVIFWVTNWNMAWTDMRGFQTPMCVSVETTSHKFWENPYGSLTVKVEVLAWWWRQYEEVDASDLASSGLSQQQPKQIGGPLNMGVRIVLSHLGK